MTAKDAGLYPTWLTLVLYVTAGQDDDSDVNARQQTLANARGILRERLHASDVIVHNGN